MTTRAEDDDIIGSHNLAARIRVTIATAVTGIVALTACGHVNPGPGQQTFASRATAANTDDLNASGANVNATPSVSAGISVSPYLSFCSDVSANSHLLTSFPATQADALRIYPVWQTVAREAPSPIKAKVVAIATIIGGIANGTTTGVDMSTISSDGAAITQWVSDNCSNVVSSAPTS